ncbi:FAD-binding protein [Candidatus Acetothermia bacterium]|nr:FAD-binding protein [Candidatus Acetothermia bacterium]MBI3643631.1 FAD-binding protein [Candidatus Acetothermia bacterium]
MEKYYSHEYDVIVIGAGGAGLRAAIEASAMGAKTALICKSLLGKAHTVMAEGGVAAAFGNVDPQDNWKIHYVDTFKAGKFLNNWRMVELYTKEATERVLELERWGALFDRTPEGKILQRPFGGHSYRRLCHVGDRTGLELIRTLQEHGIHQGFDVFMEMTITRLLKDGKRISGAFGYAREDGRFNLFRAKSVVLATGGLGKLYKITSNSWECTGDGFALAYEAGAELQDMEFVQFHPTGMVWPPGVRGLLVTEAVRGEGGLLKNSLGERFMKNYDPEKMELASRDIVSKAIYQETQAGRGTPHGGVWLDITHVDGAKIKKKLPSMWEQFHKLADLDITKEPMEIGPTTHYMMGGVRVDPETQSTNIAGLYAAGEVGCGLHGATRLGGNSLSDLLVFGKRAGESAGKFALSQKAAPRVNEKEIEDEAKMMLAPFEREGGENPFVIQSALQELMQSKVGIWRSAAPMKEAIDELSKLKEKTAKMGVSGTRLYNPGWHLTRDLPHMLDIAETIARSAYERQESRGAHTRDDFAKPIDETWGKVNQVIRQENGKVVLRKEPVPEMPAELKALFQKEVKKNG